MIKRYTFWLKTAIVLQFLTAAFHSISFFVQPNLQNDTERQLHLLITTYHEDLGLGFTPTFFDLFTALSACFPMLCVLAGLTLGYLLLKNVSPALLKGIILINVLVFGVCFTVMAVLTFPPPIIATGLIFITLFTAYFLCPRGEL